MDSNKKPNKNRHTNYARYTGIAFQMGIVIGIGVFIGVWLDKKYPNQYDMYTIIFSFVFVSLSMYQAIRQLNNTNKE